MYLYLRILKQYSEKTLRISLFLLLGANALGQASDSSSILLEAASGGNPDSVTLLLEYGADANVPKNSGHLPIHVAADRGHLL